MSGGPGIAGPAKRPVVVSSRERAEPRNGRFPGAILFALTAQLAGCGLVGLDAYGRPDPCPGEGKAVEQPTGTFTCANTPAEVILTGDLPPSDPRVTARLREASELIGGAVAYTDGKTTRTYVSPKLARTATTGT